jgi:hypothetical protein
VSGTALGQPPPARMFAEVRPAEPEVPSAWHLLAAATVAATVRGLVAVQQRVEQAAGRPLPRAEPVPRVVDVAIDVGMRTAALAVLAGRLTRPIARVALSPPLLPRQLWPQTHLDAMAARGRAARMEADRRSAALVAELVPAVLDVVLDRIDLTQLVVDRVQIDRIVATVDLNGVAALIDIDALVAGVDLNAVVERIDIDAIVAGVDLNAVVERIDIDALVSGVDLNAVVERIDIDAIAATLDLNAIIGRLDLAALANQVIEQIDLAELIRDSSGAMASETVRGVRMQGINADERVNRIVDRILLRRRRDGQDLDDHQR